MVTLLGFVFVVVNVAFIELFMPDLVGPVGMS
jgi:ethanolaminephosphotransferase